VIAGNANVSRWDVSDPARPVRTRTLSRSTDGAGRVMFSPDLSTVAGAATDGTNGISLWTVR
jgi:hypothetical protein